MFIGCLEGELLAMGGIGGEGEWAKGGGGRGEVRRGGHRRRLDLALSMLGDLQNLQ